MAKSKTESQQRDSLIDEIILSITLGEYSLNIDDYDEVVPNFVIMYRELTLIHHKTITNENYNASINAFVQDLSLNELKVWSKFI